ncbi:helix-turn-helix domain-containing protein [Shewanella algae]
MHEEKIHYWRAPSHPELEISRASFQHFHFEPHVHLDFHIGVVSHGGQDFHYRGQTWHLRPNWLSTLDPDSSHDGQSSEQQGYCAMVMSLPHDWLQQLARDLGLGYFSFAAPMLHHPALYREFCQLHHLLTQPIAANDLLVPEAAVIAFLEKLMRLHGRQLNTERQPHALSQSQLDRLREAFHADPGAPFRLPQLAKELDLSQYQLLRQFRQRTGMTPHAYLKRIRLEYAKKALLRGDSVISVAQQVGFFDQSHLNKAFKRAFLLSPQAFQRRML